ncbi:MAG: serine/threonine-protein kinase [Cyanobacteria bacterium J06598_3]
MSLSSSLPLNSSQLHPSEPTTVPLPSGYWGQASVQASHVDTGKGHGYADESTRFQDSAGNLKATKRLFKDRFEIIRRLGRGGFSTTYLAQDIATTHPLPCVIKHLKKKIAANTPKTALELERINRRFHREARMMARLGRNAQLPRLLDHFTDSDQFYIVQEHVPGPTLSQELQRSGPKSEADVKQFLREMIPVIRYIHRQRLLHLDIKPSNIIRRDSDQTLVLIDFGAVRRYPEDTTAESSSATPQRASQGAVGTIGFSPIEQLAGQPTFASDIYALGVTCLYLLTATSPLDFATSPRGQHLRWQESVNLSAHFTGILEKMLAPNLAKRFQDIEALDRAMKLEKHYEDLKTCMTTEPLTDRVFKGPTACTLGNRISAKALSHTERQAASIRRWQQRRRQFKTFVPK